MVRLGICFLLVSLLATTGTNLLAEEVKKRAVRYYGEGDTREWALSPDGKLLAFLGFKAVDIWSVTTNVYLGRAEHAEVVEGLKFSHDGNTLTTVGYKQEARMKGKVYRLAVWNVAKIEVKSSFELVSCAAPLAFSSDCRILATGGPQGTVKLWDTTSGKEKATFQGGQRAVAVLVFSPDGKTLASTEGDGTTTLWNVADSKKRATLKGNWPFVDPARRKVTAPAFSPDGKVLALLSGDNTIKLWDVIASKQLHAVTMPKGIPICLDQPNVMAFSPDGKILALGLSWMAGGIFRADPAGTLVGMEVDTGKIRFTQLCDGFIGQLCFSPNGRMLASCQYGRGPDLVKLWNISKDKLRGSLIIYPPAKSLGLLVFAADGKTLITGNTTQTEQKERKMRWWDITGAFEQEADK